MILNSQRKQKHQLLYNKVEDGHYKVAALSTANDAFNGSNGELLQIAFNDKSCNEAKICNIKFFDQQGNAYSIADTLFDIETGINNINVKDNANGAIYDLQGRKFSKAQRGVNIVDGHKLIKK